VEMVMNKRSERKKVSVSALCSSIIDALMFFEKVDRRFHPLILSDLHEMLVRMLGLLEVEAPFAADCSSLSGEYFIETLTDSARLITQAVHLFEPVDDIQQSIMNSLRAHRKICRVQEILYPFCCMSERINAFFSEERLNEQVPDISPDAHCGGKPVGIYHKGLDNDPYARGSLSLYVPESYSSLVPLPLVVVLHGGHSHGRDFIWSWIREARTRGFILAAPTSKGSTWSISSPHVDHESVIRHVDELCTQYNIDRERILITGFSDGATFALTCSQLKNTIFKNVAPISGVLVPLRVSGLKPCRIFWVHGAHDWMFPLKRAISGCRELRNAGFDVRFDIVKDLAHAYPREKNADILKWFDPSLTMKTCL